MDDSNKLPLKRVELSLSKFNEVAIPHHLDLLRQHKANITKYLECGEYKRVRAEQSSACRAAARLRALLAELEALRRRVRPRDAAAFDALTQRSRDLTLQAIVEYRESVPVSAGRGGRGLAEGAGSAASSESVGLVSADEEELIQLQLNEQETSAEEAEAVARGWGALEAEVCALHDAWRLVHAHARAQRGDVAHVEDAAERAAEHVHAAAQSLAHAERLRGVAWGGGGAVVGALLGGPVGLAVGAKAGAAAALAGSLLGYLGARLWRPRPR